MKLLITKPKDTESCVWGKSLFETWLWYNNVRTGGTVRFTWNPCYHFYDVWFQSANNKPDLDIENIVSFLASENIRTEVADSVYEYDNGIKSTYPISIRLWIYPLEEAE